MPFKQNAPFIFLSHSKTNCFFLQSRKKTEYFLYYMILNSFESICYLGKWQNVHHHSALTKTNFSFHHLLWCECINPQKCTGELKQRVFFLFIYSSTVTKIEPTNCISFCIYTKIDLIWTIIFLAQLLTKNTSVYFIVALSFPLSSFWSRFNSTIWSCW